MSLAAFTPVEKTENLIYTILPVTLSLLLGSTLSNDPTVWLSTLAIVAPVFTILLYEIAPEEEKIKEGFKAYLVEHQAQSKNDFFDCNLFIRTWESTLQPYNGITDTIVDDQSDFAGSAVSSYVARRHFWRLRATCYIMISLPMLVAMGLRTVDSGLRARAILSIDLLWWLLILVICWAVLSYIMEWLLNKARLQRVQKTEKFLESYITYLYWHTMIASDTARTPDEYQPNSVKGIVKNELDALDLLLVRNDWDIFIQRWNRLNRNVKDLAKDDYRRNFQRRAYELWGDFIFLARMKKDTKTVTRQLDWFMYYAAGTDLTESDADLLRLMKSASGSSIGLKGLLNPNLLLEQLPRTLLTEEREEIEKAGGAAIGINRIFNHSTGDVSQAARKIIQELHSPQGVGMDEQRMAEFVMQYVTERCQLGMEPFLKGYSTDHLLSVFRHVQSYADRIWLLVDWFKESPPLEVGKALEENSWSGILLDPPLRNIVLTRLMKFRGDYAEEVSILENFIQRLRRVGASREASELEGILTTIVAVRGS